MCNLYSMTTNREAMRKLFRVEGGWNQLHLPAIFPDKPAPIVRRTAARLAAAPHAGLVAPLPGLLKPVCVAGFSFSPTV